MVVSVVIYNIEEAADRLSDLYGYCIYSFNYVIRR